jgi:hypothetical protein
MGPRRLLAIGAMLAAVTLAGCSSSPKATPGTGRGSSTGSSSSAPRTSTTAKSTTSTTGTTPPSSTAATSTTTSTTAPATAQNLPVTDTIRAELLQAGAALNSLPTSDYTGLQPGQTFYAYDPASQTYWAGAALAPSSASQQAQVAAQDDGSYLLFRQPAGGQWTAYTDGMSGVPGSSCPAPVPASILALWGWPAGTCRPMG